MINQKLDVKGTINNLNSNKWRCKERYSASNPAEKRSPFPCFYDLDDDANSLSNLRSFASLPLLLAPDGLTCSSKASQGSPESI